jgi:indole-3-glycerol phosphate synthase
MTILDDIIAHKHLEVASREARINRATLEASCDLTRKTHSLIAALSEPETIGIIAEFKRRSPSKGIINSTISIETLSVGYRTAGASALSILTDEKFFGGTLEDLITARACNEIPLLRKDFIVSEYQILEARCAGADVILLIAASLTTEQIISFGRFARSLGLEVLLEVHTEEELQRVLNESALTEAVHVIGVNNRDLHHFTVDVQRTFELLPKIPAPFKKISESGIDSASTIVNLKRSGCDGFLVGEAFMKQNDPAHACDSLIREVKKAS